MAERVRAGMALSEFMQRFDEQPFEFINGEVELMTPVVFGHSEIGRIIYDALHSYAVPKQLGRPYQETAFVLEDKPNWVTGSRVPDVLYITWERLETYKRDNPDYREKALALVPDLVVEVISPTDQYSKVKQKIQTYLNDGVKLIWIVDPATESVDVYSQENPSATKHKGDTLTAEPVIPDFELSVAAIFA